MRYFFVRYQAFGDNYDGYYFDTFSERYYYTPTRALERYLNRIKQKYNLADTEIDVIQFNRI